MGLHGWLCASGWDNPGGFAVSPYKARFCSRGDGSQAPTNCARSRIWPFPCFFSLLSSQCVRPGWKGVAGRPAKCLPPPGMVTQQAH